MLAGSYRLMPKCDGLPSGPCPSGKCDATVKLGEGDLMLCADCDAERHQAFLASRGARESNAPSASANASTSVNELICFVQQKSALMPFDHLVDLLSLIHI